MSQPVSGSFSCISVIIPARNEAAHIAHVVTAVIEQRPEGAELEVIVVDDGSTDGTAAVACKAGARVVTLGGQKTGRGPAAARNQGATLAKGDPLIFLDADCYVAPGWLSAILAAHGQPRVGAVGGALELPPALPAIARCDYYCGWYLVHARRAAGFVPHHPPPNLSVRRDVFYRTSGFSENPPLAYTNEERAWQAEVQRTGQRIYFEPQAVAYHYNRPGWQNLLRRNYRWGYTAIESKCQTGAARLAWLYRSPYLLIALSMPLIMAQTAYICGCWIRVGVFEPLLMLPAVLASRFAYGVGMMVGGIQWLRYRRRGSSGPRPRPRWQ